MGDVNEYRVETVEAAEGAEPPEGRPLDILSEDELAEVSGELVRKYKQQKANRYEKEQTWAKWRRQFEARPKHREKNWPYPNASNISPPLAQIVGQSLWAHLKSMYDAIDPPWYIEPLRQKDEQLIKEAAALTRYYNITSKSRLDLNLSKFKRDFLQEIGVMGTCFVKVPWITEPWYFRGEEGGVETEVSAVLHDGPALLVVPVEDLVYPENWDSMQRAPWVAHDFVRAEHELQDLATRGVYDGEAVDDVIAYRQQDSGPKMRNREEILQTEFEKEGEYGLTEFYFFYDSDGDGLHEDLMMTVHVPSGTVLRQDYNRFGYRMISAGAFINRTFAIEGRGSGQTCEYQQDEVEGIHNVRNDNMKFSNMRMLAVRRGVFRENESIYPGKMFQVDNPKEDIMPIQLGEVYPSSLQAENQTMSYAREASGMASIMSGFADETLGTRDTYRGQAMRMNKGMGLFSTIAEGLNECFSEIGMMIFFQLVEHRDEVIRKEREAMRMSEEDIELLASALSIQYQDIPKKLAFHIRTSDVDETFEAKRQNMLSLTQLFSQYAQQVTPIAMQLFGPQGQQMQKVAPEAFKYLLSLYTGSTKLMEEVFRFFGEEDPTKYLPDIRKQELLQDMLRKMTSDMVERFEAIRQGNRQMLAGAGPAPGEGQGVGGPPQGGAGEGGVM